MIDADHGESESQSRRRRGPPASGKAQGQRCRTRRHLPGLPPTEHPPQPAGGLRRRILGAVGSTRRRSARRRTGCVAAALPATHEEAQDSRWLQDTSADSVAWAAHGMPESPHEISRPGHRAYDRRDSPFIRRGALCILACVVQDSCVHNVGFRTTQRASYVDHSFSRIAHHSITLLHK